MEENNNLKEDKNISNRNRILLHLAYHIVGLGVVTIFGKLSINQPDWHAVIVGIFLITYTLFYFGSYLLERIAIQKNYKRSLAWLLSKLISIIVNVALGFTYCYILMYYTYPDSIEDTTVLGKGIFEKFLTFFHFSLGNFFGMNSQIVVSGVAFKIIQIIQALTAFSLLVFLFSNYNVIREHYSKYYKKKD